MDMVMHIIRELVLVKSNLFIKHIETHSQSAVQKKVGLWHILHQRPRFSD